MTQEILKIALLVFCLSFITSLVIYIASSCWIEFRDYVPLHYYSVEILCKK